MAMLSFQVSKPSFCFILMDYYTSFHEIFPMYHLYTTGCEGVSIGKNVQI